MFEKLARREAEIVAAMTPGKAFLRIICGIFIALIGLPAFFYAGDHLGYWGAFLVSATFPTAAMIHMSPAMKWHEANS